MLLKEWIKKTEWPLLQIARKLKVNQQSLRNYMEGSTTPSLLVALKLFKMSGYEIEISTLLSHKDRNDYETFTTYIRPACKDKDS